MTKKEETGSLTTLPPTLAGRLLLVHRELENVPKTGFNEHQRYKYVKEADLVERVRQVCAAHGVVVVASGKRVTKTDVEIHTRSGAVSRIWEAEVTFSIINADDREDRIESTYVGHGADTGDKGVYKAYAGARKYFLFHCFGLAGDDDAEAAAEHDKEDGTVSAVSVASAVSAPPRSESALAPEEEVAPQGGGKKKTYPPIDTSAMAFAYKIPYIKTDQGTRDQIKRMGYRFNGADKTWCGDVPLHTTPGLEWTSAYCSRSPSGWSGDAVTPDGGGSSSGQIALAIGDDDDIPF